MVVTKEDIQKVLAMFDKEDIPYILSDFVVKMALANEHVCVNDTTHNKVKVKTRGDKNGGSRK